MIKRYHVDVYFEQKDIDSICFDNMHFMASYHYRTSPRRIPMPSKEVLKRGKVFEYYKEDGKMLKFVIRCPYNAKNDVIYVIKPNGFIITSWLNAVDDEHETLQEWLYEKGM